MFEFTSDETLIIIVFLVIPFVCFISYLLWTNRCPKGGLHEFETTDERFVQGNDIGFGITNSFTHQTCKCKKCDYSFKTFN